ncbi:MAG: N-acetylmuramic acid 6-phosphate etherase [Candidatus Latescibacteria bacterium]|nr:N-acetylmuramic acid 6-phosphate etherase [Candidatus Latescibacterota bacterium]
MADRKRGRGPAGSSKWASLLTEQRNPATEAIDELATLDMLGVMNDEDRQVPEAVGEVLPQVAEAVDRVVEAFQHGGRLFYVGAGTSGRLGVIDAAECPPTFGTDPEMVQGIIAGGPPALVRAQEGAEDRADDGSASVRERGLCEHDVLMGIAASGVTPFVLGALEEARRIGADTIFFTCNPESAARVSADVKITPVVGPEVVTGSTRLKAATSTKLVLNMITTAAMIRTGKVYGNLMVDLNPTCAKLEDRAIRILMEVSGLSREESQSGLQAAGNDLKTAIVMAKRAVSVETAREWLRQNGGVVKRALGASADER